MNIWRTVLYFESWVGILHIRHNEDIDRKQSTGQQRYEHRGHRCDEGTPVRLIRITIAFDVKYCKNENHLKSHLLIRFFFQMMSKIRQTTSDPTNGNTMETVPCNGIIVCDNQLIDWFGVKTLCSDEVNHTNDSIFWWLTTEKWRFNHWFWSTNWWKSRNH